MAKLSDLFGGRKESGPERYAPRTPGRRDDDTQLTSENYSDVGSRIGEANESLRNLLTDTGRKIGELDDLKAAFDKIVAPFNSTLRALEQEKSLTLSLSGMLAEARAAYETLREETYQVEKKATALETESERLREDLELARENNRGLESTRIELSNEISGQQAQIAELERQLAQETAQRRQLSENKRTQQETIDAAEKRIVELEGELAAAREKLALLDDEKRSLQLSVDQALNETARLTRRLAATLDETKEQHQAERNSLNMRLDALQSRAATAEKLLVEARQNLIARTEEVRAFDRKSVEATIARNNAEKRLAQIEASHEARDRQIKDLETSRAALSERSNALAKTLKTRETALARAEEKIASLTERTGHLEADIQISRTNIEKRVEDLNSALQRERMERAVVEGALEAARKDNSRLQSEVAALRTTLRRGLPFQEVPVVPAEASEEPAKEPAAAAGAAETPREAKA